ncbi:MAG: low molecular weight phosphatase family protein [Alphaproteobacteria bacterium]|nr:low molecular weight phosphatase family protein [Alphaproteobacteria bacterium]
MNPKLPSAILFACTMNAIRSPMAAAIMHHHFGHKVYVASAGIAAGDPDPFVGLIMDEIGIDLKRHRPHSFEDLEDSAFDLLVTLSPEAQKRAQDMSRTMAIDVENWVIPDPSGTQGSRDQILDAYRQVRDDLAQRIKSRFGA